MDILNRLAMLMMAKDGSTKAHLFIHECGVRPMFSMRCANKHIFDQNARFFVPPKNEDRVIMFSDNSGAYIHGTDFICTFLSSDVGRETKYWTEIAKIDTEV